MENYVIDSDWSTVIFFKPTLWWRLKMLFKPHDLTFCYSDKYWFADGFTDQQYLSCGGVPDCLHYRLQQGPNR